MWIKLHTSITEWEWFTRPEMLQLFIYLLTRANYKDKAHQGGIIHRGQLITTTESLCLGTGLSPRQIRTCLERLCKSGEISKETTNKNTIITICNYDRYQLDERNDRQTNDNKTTNDRQTKDKPYIYTEYTDNNNSLYNAHARETLIPPDLEDCYNILSNDRSWQESVLINLHSRGYRHIHFQQFAEHLQLFFSKLRAEGSDYKHPRDAKHHFTNWIIIQLEKQKNESNRTNHSRKQDANAYALSQFTDYYSNMDEEIPNPFTD